MLPKMSELKERWTEDMTPDSERAEINALPSLNELEKAHIEQVVSVTHGNLSWAARVLGVDRRTLYRKLAKIKGSRS
jgi:Response regulator containing CheY-like receiver, AAA-type ATPase, and DNA-binding domains